MKKIPSHPACYQIIENIPFAKLTRFYFLKDCSILYTAKYKKNHFYIGSGDCFHIHEKRVENCAQITCDKDNYNKVVREDQEFAICFVGYSGGYSIDVSFENNGEKLHWEPKEVKEDAEFDGEYKHSPIHTDRNIILQDSKMKNCLIIRKMSKEVIEAECNPDVNPIIIFAIAISQIIGPFSSGHNFHKSFVN
ncbi:hypothetical protein M9Y10_037515 [Tritrichomonas musculus]|uniref:Tubby C-terminal domain-containing protein n=1 Tax=Tritrichomonas musculus TaxID=1915356 RepID=A0ABR2GSD4_9EUKA